jgi:hypothetical protein
MPVDRKDDKLHRRARRAHVVKSLASVIAEYPIQSLTAAPETAAFQRVS